MNISEFIAGFKTDYKEIALQSIHKHLRKHSHRVDLPINFDDVIMALINEERVERKIISEAFQEVVDAGILIFVKFEGKERFILTQKGSEEFSRNPLDKKEL